MSLQMIFHAMNWLRELVNAFHLEDPPKVRHLALPRPILMRMLRNSTFNHHPRLWPTPVIH
jgi:hypothetical protein